MTIVGYACALLIGVTLGLLGGGGSILTVPVLHYILGYDVKEAIPMSLLVVGLTSGFGAIAHWRAGTIHLRTALSFGPPAVVGAVLGAELGLKVDARVQLTVFAVVVLLAAVSMLIGGFARTPPAATDAPPAAYAGLLGALVGVLTGFVGVGGGFLYVPALVAFGKLPMKAAIGTSLVLILLSCAAGLVRYAGHLSLDWSAVALFTLFAFAGVAAGSRLVPYLSQQTLKRGFAILLLITGSLVLFRGR